MSRSLAIGIAVTALILLGVTLSCVYSVYQTQQAIIVEFGAPQAIVSEAGLHFKTPWQQVYYFNRQLMTLDAKGEEAMSLDGKTVVIDAFARWRIDDPLQFYKRFVDQRTAQLQLAQVLSSDIRRVLGAQDFAALLSERRAALMAALRDQMNRDAKGFGVAFADVRIRRADLPPDGMRAVYQSMQKAREQEAAQFRAEGDAAAQAIRADADLKASVIKAEAEKQADIVEGEGDAQSTQILGAAYGQDPDFAAFWQSMQAYRDTFSSSTTTVVLTPKSEFFKYFGEAPGGGGKK